MILDTIFGFRPRPSRAAFSAIDAARTDRLNKSRWVDAKDQSVNSLLASDLSELRARAMHEYLNNPLVKGVVKTYADDVVGAMGPKLSVQSDSDAFNESLEEVWREWWMSPDAAGRHSGADILKISSNMVWTAGDYIWQLTSATNPQGPIALRIRMIHPRRMATPFGEIASGKVMMGVEIDDIGTPVAYWIDQSAVSNYTSFASDYVRVPARDIIHDFECMEPDQVRGFPWLMHCLDVVSELRAYDQQVMDAARMAASLAVYLFTESPDAETQTFAGSYEIERGMASVLPPGYKPAQVTPQQPSAQYAEFRHERLRELGRPVGMPLLTVNLDARGHSWSSARLDRDVYHSGIRSRQGETNRRGLNRLVDLVAREGVLAGVIPIPPEGMQIKYVWTWPVFQSIDPQKEDKAATERLKNLTSNLKEECARKGIEWDENLMQRAREEARIKKLGLSWPWHRDAGADESSPDDDEEVQNRRLAKRNGTRIPVEDIL